ncbi:MAG: MFS transporter [Ilumatobacteraceae bacterium]
MGFPRDIRALAIARLVSEMGDELALIALLFRLKDSGPLAVSALLATFAATRIVLAPLTGNIVDTVATRRLIVTVSLAQFAVTTLLAFVEGPSLYLFVFALAVGGSIVGPTWQSFIAVVVPHERLSKTYAFIQTFRSVAIVGGAGLGGLLVNAFGSRAALLVNAATFLFVAAVGATLQTQRVPSAVGRGRAELMQGFRVLFTRPVLRWSLFLLASFNMSAGVIEVMGVFLVTDELGGNASDYGFVVGSLGVSMVVTGAILSRLQLPGKDTTLLMLSALTSATGMALYGLSPNVVTAVVAFLINGAGLTGLHVFGTPIVVRNTHEHERGRVFAATSSVTTGGILLATGIAGAVSTVFAAREVIVSAALLCLLCAVFGGSSIRRSDRDVLVD